MNLDKILLPATALGAIALLFGTETSRGFSTIGGQLGQAQRDVRLFNNFSKANANNNTAADDNWPGYDGAEMAIWKGCSEWGSELHGGNGAGDPLQAVGSGGANFDISWQGNATGIGTTNQNIHSEIGGSSGGVLAFCETPISDGWRIRYYENWNWQDGPGSVGSGIDIQGVACHEYGHALGLGHTNVGGSTMFPSISGSGTPARSIEADDIAGVQFIYGAKSGSKPHISNVLVNAGQVTIAGNNFSGSGNEVWFTQAAQGGNGEPIKVTGVTSTNGTSITVAIPGTAGPGDVLVRSNGVANSNLSNAFPFDPNAGPGCFVANYCVAKLSSNFCVPQITSQGTPSIGIADFFFINTSGMETNVAAIDIFGTAGQAAIPFQGGTLCIAGQVFRLNGQLTGGAGTCAGTLSYTLQDVLDNPAGGGLVVVGGTVNIQSWSRDLGDVFGSSLSDALEILVCP